MMAAPSTRIFELQLSRLHLTLAELLLFCEQRRKENEKSCSAYQLLFKPWPSSSKEGSDKDKTSEVQEEQDEISETEKSELSALDNLLQKAQKARRIQKKLNEPMQQTKKTKHKEDHDEALTISDNHSYTCKFTNNPEKTISKSGLKKAPISNHSKDKDRVHSIHQTGPTGHNADVGVIEKSKLSRLLGKPPAKSKSAHIHAPFQTKPEISKSQRTVIVQRSLGAKSRSSESRQGKLNSAPCRTQSMDREKGKFLKQSRTDSAASNGMRKMVKSGSDNDLQLDQKNNKDIFEYKKLPDIQNMYHVNSKESNTLEEKKINTQNNGANHHESSTTNTTLNRGAKKEEVFLEDKPKEQFSLVADGSRLCIPSKLRRLYANNLSLRKKALNQQHKGKDLGDSKAAHFVNKFETRIVAENQSSEVSFLPWQVDQLLRTYTQLQVLFNSIDWSTLHGESVNWKNIVRTKSVMEYMIDMYNHLEQQYQSVLSEVILHQKNHQSETLTGFEKLKPKLKVPSWCWYKDLNIPNQPKRLFYGSQKQLLEYFSLRHEVQLLQLQLWLLNSFHKTLIDAPSELECYRGVYSILTSFGSSFPTMVKDEID